MSFSIAYTFVCARKSTSHACAATFFSVRELIKLLLQNDRSFMGVVPTVGMCG